MSVVWRSHGGHWRNGKATGKGELYNGRTKTIHIGEFKDSLTVSSGPATVVDYSGSDALIYVGEFVEGQKQGTIVRYTISKSEWSALLASRTGKVVTAAKETCTFADDVYVGSSLSETKSLRITLAIFINPAGVIITKFELKEI